MPTNNMVNDNAGGQLATGTLQTSPQTSIAPTFGDALASFMSKVDEVAERFSKPKTFVIKSLIENTCEYRTRYEIENPLSYTNEKFDTYFRIKHEFQKNKFVQRLAIALRQRGVQAYVSTEEKQTVGIFDVLVTNARSLVTVSDNRGKRIVVEWKASASFDLSQIERYLWQGETVVLVRTQLNQVVRIKRTDIEHYLKNSLIALTEKSAVIASVGNLLKVPGPFCAGCPAQSCEFYKSPPKVKKVIAFRSDTMQDDLLLVYNNLDQCIDQAIDVVMQELTD